MVSIYGTMIFKSKFEEDILNVKSTIEQFENKSNSMSDFLIAIGFSLSEIEERVIPEDKVCYIDDIQTIDNEIHYFRIDFESHGNFPKFLKESVESKCKVEVIYQYDDMDNNVYVNTDKSGLYLPDRYLLDMYISHTNVYHTTAMETLDECIEFIGNEYKSFKDIIKGYKTIGDVNKALDEFFEDDDSYCNIHEYGEEC